MAKSSKEKEENPNKLGEMEVSCGKEGENASEASSKNKNGENTKKEAEMSPIVADIDRRLKMPIDKGGINLFYAVEGYEMSSGRPIVDYSKLVDTLITYGYDIDSILEYADIMQERKKGPIVSQSKDMAFMYDDVNAIPEVKELVKKFKR